ncbi:MAG: SpoIIE family protein phosphatase [Pseudomonadota bacterium]
MSDVRPEKGKPANYRSYFKHVFTGLLDMILILHRKETGLITRFDLIRMKYEVVSASLMANALGFLLLERVIFRGSMVLPHHELGPLWNLTHFLLPPLLFLLSAALTLFYETPIHQCAEAIYKQEIIPDDLLLSAKRRVLNEPFFVVLLTLGLWLLAGAAYSMYYLGSGPWSKQALIPSFVGLNAGLIISTILFFMAEHLMQYHRGPYFFPEGGLSGVPGTLRIKISVRLLALIVACNLIPLLSLIQIIQMQPQPSPDVAYAPEALRSILTTNALIFMGVGVLLTLQVALNFSLPFRDIIRVLEHIRRGDFNQRITVTSNDEVGYTGDIINEMTAGLKDRERMRQSLDLAREVQQNMLPRSVPRVQGLDIAGRSIFCDETGGDYLDYLDMLGRQPGKIGIIVGDVSDHGLQAALLMISARAYLRHHAFHSENIAEIVTDANWHLCNDVRETGRFMTLFFTVIDSRKRQIRWVRAGHDPAVIYDPAAAGDDPFEELGGQGVPLGVHDSFQFTEYQRPIAPGQIIALATDGVWEDRNPDGEQFGKHRLRQTIRANAHKTATEVLEAILAEMERFSGSPKCSDDVTLVIVKVGYVTSR